MAEITELVTLGELSRRLARIEGKLDQRLYVQQDVFELWVAEVKEIRESIKWAIRSIAIVALGLLGNIIFFIVTGASSG